MAARYPLGYGLSYTTFEYESLSLDTTTAPRDGNITATVRVRNTGGIEGIETVQLYVRAPGEVVPRAVRDLRAFARVTIPAGGMQDVELTFPVASLTYYDEDAGTWALEPGTYTVDVGGNAAELPHNATFNIAN